MSRSPSKSNSRKRRGSPDESEHRRSRRDYDDEHGHYIMQPGDRLDYDRRYVIKRQLGEGTFGKVVECVDRRRSDRVCAIKVIKSIQKYRDAARVELEILLSLKKHNPSNSKHFVHLMGHFDYHRHICMVFPLLGLSLFDFMKVNGFRAFDMPVVRSIAYQIVECIEFCHARRLTHTDLKPENILLEDSSYTRPVPGGPRLLRHTRIQVIDFGSATWKDDHHTTIVSTRHYRAPEIILGLGWDAPCDQWSIGCIMFELMFGDVLFQTHDNLEHLNMMARVLGPVPHAMRINKSKSMFFEHGELIAPIGISFWRRVNACQTLRENFPKHLDDSQRDLFDLLERLLCFDPAGRISSHDALHHPFFRHTPLDELLDAGTDAHTRHQPHTSDPDPAHALATSAEGISAGAPAAFTPALSRTVSLATDSQTQLHHPEPALSASVSFTLAPAASAVLAQAGPASTLALATTAHPSVVDSAAGAIEAAARDNASIDHSSRDAVAQ